MQSYKNVDAYIATFSGETKKKLITLRTLIQKAAPAAEEKISYGMPGYKLGGKVLLYFGGFKGHVSLFPMPGTILAFKKELMTYTTSKGTVQFPLDKALPVALIKKLIAFRVKGAGKPAASKRKK